MVVRGDDLNCAYMLRDCPSLVNRDVHMKKYFLMPIIAIQLFGLFIPYRRTFPIMDGCCDITAGTTCQSQGGCTQYTLDHYAKREKADYCVNSEPMLGWAYCTMPKTFMLRELTFSAVRSLAEKNVRYLTLEQYRAVLAWAQ